MGSPTGSTGGASGTESIVLDLASMNDVGSSPSSLTTARGPGPSPYSGHRLVTPGRLHGAVIGACAVVIVAFTPRVGSEDLGPLGLASILPLGVYLAFGVLVTGFAIAAIRRHPSRLLGGYTVATAALLHGLGPLAYELPRFSWAWKHAGIVDYILRFQAVDPTIESLNAYHNWPGFFGLNALLTETGGLESPLSYAAWVPVFFNIVYLAALYLLFRTFSFDERLIWTGLMIFTIGNWVGQDYFAPQSPAYLFYILIAGILLHWFPGRSPRHGRRETEPVVMATVLLVLVLAVVIGHQLTPVITIIAIGGLALTRRTHLAWPAIAALVFMALWLTGFASPFASEYGPKIWRDLQGILDRVETGLIDHGQVDTSQVVVSRVTRGLSALLVVLAGLGFLRSRKGGIRWWPAVILAGAPLVLVAASSYGNEILFRALYFALPALALFAAALWFPCPERGRNLMTGASLAVVLAAMIPLSIVAQHGNDVRTVFSQDEVDVAGLMYDMAPAGSAVIQLSHDYPTKFRNYENLEELTIGTFSIQARDLVVENPEETIVRWAEEGGYTETYVLITRTQSASVARLGTLPPGAPSAIGDAMLASARFEVLANRPDAVLFRVIPEVAP